MPDFASYANVIELAAVTAGAAVPAGMHASFPVPSLAGSGLRFAVLYGTGMVARPEERYQLWPPSYLAFFRADSGRFDELRAIKPEDYGQSSAIDQPIGHYSSPPERMNELFMTCRAKLYQAADQIVPAFATGQPPSSALKQAATEFQAAWGQVAEAPWLPYYHAVAAEFFGWLKRVAC